MRWRSGSSSGKTSKTRLIDQSSWPPGPFLCADLEVFLDRVLGEYLAILGHVADARARDDVRRAPRDILARDLDHAALRRRDAGDRLHGRALAGAVAAEQRQRPALVQLEADAEQDLALAVEDIETVDADDRAAAHVAASSWLVPR